MDSQSAEPKQSETKKATMEAPSLENLDSDDDQTPLPDPDLLSPKSAKIVKLTQALRQTKKEMQRTKSDLDVTKKRHASLQIKTKSEVFQKEVLQKQLGEAKEAIQVATDKQHKAEETLSKKQAEFQVKFDELYKTQEANYKAKTTGATQQEGAQKQCQSQMTIE